MPGEHSGGESQSPEAVVGAFIAAIEERQLERALQFMAPDVEYDNVPLPVVHGHQGVREFLAPFIENSSAVQFEVHRQLAAGDTVMNERTDRFEMPTGMMEIPVVGVWEVQRGKITLWRDYFDISSVTGQGAGGADAPGASDG